MSRAYAKSLAPWHGGVAVLTAMGERLLMVLKSPAKTLGAEKKESEESDFFAPNVFAWGSPVTVGVS
ncbi:MAG: hypothetical protein U0793_09470 [Gemmataceae bacterium]